MDFSCFKRTIFAVFFSTLALGKPVDITLGTFRNTKVQDYSSIVVFGASWADNGHPRPQKYASTLRPPPNYQGRYCHGIIWNEYLANGLLTGEQILHFNYAIGGAVLSTKLTYSDKPDTRTQLNQYISDVKNGKVNRGTGSTLHIWWIGINSMTQIWLDAIKMDPSMTRSDILEKAYSRVDQHITELEQQLIQARSEPAVNSVPSDYLVLPIPPLEAVLTFKHQAEDLAKNDTQLATTYLQLIGDLSHRFNEGIHRFVLRAEFEDQNPTSPYTTGWVKSYDFEYLWRRLIANPREYGLEVSDEACLNEASGRPVVCSNPDQYLFWDTLHPTTAAHKIMAMNFLQEINS